MKQLSYYDLEKLSHQKQVMFALFCAKQNIHLLTDESSLKAIAVVELYLEGKASKKECKVAAAAYAAYAAAYADAAYAAAYAAYADADAKQKNIEEQWAYYDELLNTDKYFEQIVLGNYE